MDQFWKFSIFKILTKIVSNLTPDSLKHSSKCFPFYRNLLISLHLVATYGQLITFTNKTLVP